MRLFPMAVLPIVVACSNEPSHIPNPLLLPADGVSAALENGVYGERRARVKRFVTQNWNAVRADISKGAGPTLETAIMIAGVSPAKCQALINELRNHPVHTASPENLTVALMVHRS